MEDEGQWEPLCILTMISKNNPLSFQSLFLPNTCILLISVIKTYNLGKNGKL